MATAGSKQAAAAVADQAEFDPKWEWQENDTSFSYRGVRTPTYCTLMAMASLPLPG